MAREEQTSKTEKQLRDRAWELAASIRIATLVTWNGKQQVIRPMDSTVVKDEEVIYFLTDVKGKKVAHIKKYPAVALSFADTGSMKFVTMAGTGEISNDRPKIKEIWTATSKAWWESEDDPAIRLVTFKPKSAELWDSPNILVSTVLMLTAAVTGAKPKIGDHAKLSI